MHHSLTGNSGEKQEEDEGERAFHAEVRHDESRGNCDDDQVDVRFPNQESCAPQNVAEQCHHLVQGQKGRTVTKTRHAL